MKTCTRCGESRPVADYRHSDQTRDGLGIYCKPCRKLFGQEKYERLKLDPVKFERRRAYLKEHHRRQHLQRRYGLSLEAYEEMLCRQDGRCAGCGADAAGRSLAVDHDHSCCPATGWSCGKCLRGLLCTNCNSILGMAEDDVDRLMALVSYLLQRVNLLGEVSR